MRIRSARFGAPVIALAAVGFLIAGATGAVAADPPVAVVDTPVDTFAPTASEGYVAYVSNSVEHPRHLNTFLVPDGGTPIRVNEDGTVGFTPGLDGTSMVYQQIENDQADLKLYDVLTGTRSDPPAGVNTPRWETDPSISGDWILFSRFDPSRPGSWQRVVLFNLATSEERILLSAKLNAGPIFGEQVQGNFALYSDCTDSCNEWLYDIAAETATEVPKADGGGHQSAGSVTADGTVYTPFYPRQRLCGTSEQIRRYDTDGTMTVLFDLPDGYTIEWKSFALETATGTDYYFDQRSCDEPDGNIYVIRGAEA